MKTISYSILVVCMLLCFSCVKDNQMLTRINSDGSIYREFTRNADSAFMVGNTSESQFPIDIDSSWQIKWKYNSTEIHSEWPLKTWKNDTINKDKIVTVWASRKYNSLNDLSSNFKYKKSHEWNDLNIQYSLEKRFRWFYNYYTYKELYPKLNTFDRIPIEKYMNNEEALFWFNGNPEIIKGKNGIEIKEFTERIEEKFNKWFSNNLWEIQFEILINNYDSFENFKISKDRLLIAKDSIFKEYVNKEWSENKFEIILDDFFKTTEFSKLSKLPDNPFEKYKNYIESQSFIKYFHKEIKYQLLMPGKILQANNAEMRNDTLEWNITAYRMVFRDCEISSTSRKANIWAFIVTGFFLFLTIGLYFYKTNK